mgnify:CR=1 FL=1
MKVYSAVVYYDGEHTGDKVSQELCRIKLFIKSETMRKDSVEMAIEVFVKNNDLTFVENIKSIEGVKDRTLIQYNGEYHG